MSEENQVPPTEEYEEITPEEKIRLLNEWHANVAAEIGGYVVERDKIKALYTDQKARFDRLLATKVKRMRKYDTIINARTKVLTDIEKEIVIASNGDNVDNTGTTEPSGSIGQEET